MPMARIRTIQPDFARSPSMARISREARLLFVLLWTIVDDEGRCHAAPDDLASVLYPADCDASIYLMSWLYELECEGCVERYTVDDIDYLRVTRWHRHQQIDHPTPSRLPRAAHERPDDSRIRDASRKLRGTNRNIEQDQELADGSCTFREKSETEGPVVVTQDGLLRDLQRIQRNAEADGAHPSALRSVELRARLALSAGKDRATEIDDEIGMSPAQAHGLPETRPRR